MNNIDKKFAVLKNVIKNFKDEINSSQKNIKHQSFRNDNKQIYNKKRNYFKFTPKEISHFNQISEKERNTTKFVNNSKRFPSEKNFDTNYFLFDSGKNKKKKSYNCSNCKYKNKMKMFINEYNKKNLNSNGMNKYDLNNLEKYCILSNEKYLKENNEIMNHYRKKTNENITERSNEVSLENRSQMLPNYKNNISLSTAKKHKITRNDYFNKNFYYLNNDLKGFYSTRKKRSIDNEKIQEIINSSNVDNIVKRAEYFDEFGKNNYNKFIKSINHKQYFLSDSYNLKGYRDYIFKEINEGKKINKEINLFKKLCKRLINNTDKSKLKEIVDDVENNYIRNKEDEYMLDNLIDTFNLNIGK